MYTFFYHFFIIYDIIKKLKTYKQINYYNGVNMRNFIGILDSGIGGLSVYQEIKEQLPNENIIYFADEINCPYGIKTIDEVRKITLNNINYLTKRGAKLIIIACNTASSSIDDIIEKNSNYLIGVVKPTAYYVKNFTSGNIGLFANELTVKSLIYKKYLDSRLIISENCSDFVPYIEKHDYNSVDMNKLIKMHTDKMKSVDILILGCTHFKFIESKIIQVLPNITIIDSSIPVCNEVKKILENTNDFNISLNEGKSIYVTSGSLKKAEEQLNNLGIKFDKIEMICN